METFLKQIKFIEQKERDLVCGYTHESQIDFSKDNHYFIIPSLVIYTILYYFYDPEKFDESGAGLTLNEDQTVVTQTGEDDLWTSVYGNRLIPADSKCIYEWKFKIFQKTYPFFVDQDSYCCILGIHSFEKAKKILDNDFSENYEHKDYAKSNFWAISNLKDKFSNDIYAVSYGSKWKNDDIITMLLDTINEKLSFYVNDEDFGVAFEDMILHKETYMAVAIGVQGFSVELISFLCKDD